MRGKIRSPTAGNGRARANAGWTPSAVKSTRLGWSRQRRRVRPIPVMSHPHIVCTELRVDHLPADAARCTSCGRGLPTGPTGFDPAVDTAWCYRCAVRLDNRRALR